MLGWCTQSHSPLECMVQAFGPIEKPGEVQGAMDPGSNSRFSPEAMDPGRLKTPPPWCHVSGDSEIWKIRCGCFLKIPEIVVPPVIIHVSMLCAIKKEHPFGGTPMTMETLMCDTSSCANCCLTSSPTWLTQCLRVDCGGIYITIFVVKLAAGEHHKQHIFQLHERLVRTRCPKSPPFCLDLSLKDWILSVPWPPK